MLAARDGTDRMIIVTKRASLAADEASSWRQRGWEVNNFRSERTV